MFRNRQAAALRHEGRVPDWSAELSLAIESRACGQFVLYGNVHDCLAVAGHLRGIERFIQDELLSAVDVIFAYDLGNGLTVERGEKRLAQWAPAVMRTLPQQPLEAVRFASRYLRYLGNLSALGQAEAPNVAILIRGIDQVLPADGSGFEHGSLTYLVRDWGMGAPFIRLPFVSLLIADNLTDVEPLVVNSPKARPIHVPLPAAEDLEAALHVLQTEHPQTIPLSTDLSALAAAVAGVTVNTLEQITKVRAHTQQPLQSSDFAVLKKDMVERDAPGLIEFVESTRTLEDYHGQQILKNWLRQDIELWRLNDARALPMGYLLSGPIGTGKTFLVECLAGEAGVPVLKLKNFRDKWIGSSEANLEKIFRLIRALGRCIVFIDEADQTLGRRDSGIGDGGLSGRLYSMIAQEMSDTANRGKVIWVFASSRPDLIEADLKRPGRIDVKIPILPTATPEQAAALVATLAQRYGLEISAAELEPLRALLPYLLTPGAAEALVVKAYRVARTENIPAGEALARSLEGYQSAVPQNVLELQIRLAVREATDLAFVPKELRHFATDGDATH
jgi:hypothetical protein